MHFYTVNFNQAGVRIARPSTGSSSATPRGASRSRSKNFIFVENLNDNVTEDYLKRHLRAFGQVVHVSIPMHQGLRRGLAKAVFVGSVDGIVQKLHGTTIAGDKLWVCADPKAKLFEGAFANVVAGTYIGPVQREEMAAKEAVEKAAKEEAAKKAAEKEAAVRATPPSNFRGVYPCCESSRVRYHSESSAKLHPGSQHKSPADHTTRFHFPKCFTWKYAW